ASIKIKAPQYTAGGRLSGTEAGKQIQETIVNLENVGKTGVSVPGYYVDPETGLGYSGLKAAKPTDVFLGSPGSQTGLANVKVQLEAQKQVSVSRGGYYVDPYGRGMSSGLTPQQLNKEFVSAGVAPISLTKPEPGLAAAVSAGKPFVGQYVQTGFVGEDISVITQRQREVVSAAQQSYAQQYLSSFTPVKERTLTAKEVSELSLGVASFARGERTPQVIAKTKAAQQMGLITAPKIPTIITPSLTSGFTKEEVEILGRTKVEGYGGYIIERAGERFGELFDYWGIKETKIGEQRAWSIGEGKPREFGKVDLWGGFAKPTSSILETISDIAGGFLTSPKYQSQQLQANLLYTPQEKISFYKDQYQDFKFETLYMGKQIAETAAYFVPGGYALTTTLSISRMKGPEEGVVPFVIGAGSRIILPKAIQKLGVVGKITKADKAVTAFVNRILIGTKPVLGNVLGVNKVSSIISDSVVAKGLLYGGASLEIAGMALTPKEYKEEYLKQTGIYNVMVPAGYKTTDIGLMLGKTAGIKLLAPIHGYETSKLQSVMDVDLYAKFLETEGGTPVYRGTEMEMFRTSAYGSKFGPAEKGYSWIKSLGYEKADMQDSLLMYRAVRGKLEDITTPKQSMYEAYVQDFFSGQVHPIALKGVGLKQKILGSKFDPYSRYSLSIEGPSLKPTVSRRAVAVSWPEEVEFTYEAYKQLKKIYGGKVVEMFPSETVKIGKKVPAVLTKTLSQTEFEKIYGGGRPYKARDLIAVFGEESFAKYFVEPEGGMFRDQPTFFTSQSRAVGTTKEWEALTETISERLPIKKETPFTIKLLGKEMTVLKTPKATFRKLGFADVYIEHDFEMIPANLYRLQGAENKMLLDFSNKLIDTKAVMLVPGEGKKQITYTQRLISGPKQTELIMYGPMVKTKGISFENLGGLSGEMSEEFLKKSVFKDLMIGPTVPRKEKAPSEENYYKVLTDTSASFAYITPKYSEYRAATYPTVEYTTYKEPIYIPPEYPPYKPPTYSEPEYPPYKYPPYKPPKYPDYEYPTYKPPRYPPHKYPPYKPPKYPPYKPPKYPTPKQHYPTSTSL
ncbi:MAG TPA: hypothetical protein PKN54_08255, partial [Candidatus Cloacimonas acidaminovorans]|nr:hypothetical protein [Candidatus Cloacimonas acidaminovorans]